jgi:hypothetical protein
MPADYVSELAEQAFKKIAAGTAEEIVGILPERPQDTAALANQLHSRPDLQAQVSSLAGYTPSEWLLEGVQFSSELIEFIWMVFNQLELVLPEKRDHPYARGWSRIFTKWTKIDVVQDGWKRYRDSYSTAFRRFAESHCVGLPPEKSE